MLSRIAREMAAEIANHDWSDAPYRLDRAGHQRTFDRGWRQAKRLTNAEAVNIRTNVMWVTAQVLGHADPALDVEEYAKECKVEISRGGLIAGLRTRGHVYATPGGYDYPYLEHPVRCYVCHHSIEPNAQGEVRFEGVTLNFEPASGVQGWVWGPVAVHEDCRLQLETPHDDRVGEDLMRTWTLSKVERG